MKKCLLFLMSALLIFTGCAGHYYRKNNGTLSIFLKMPNARRVYFLSSLNGYKPQKAIRVNDRTWQIDAPAQTEFKYFYKVDGKVYLPNCRLKEQDDFGSQNCIYIPGM
ncbi:MAG: hypothetical protein P8X68_04710 [Desulfobacterales bacterium]|jgi:hypothetical protein